MWPCSLASAEITSPSALSDLLMACASFSCSPVEPDFFTLHNGSRGLRCRREGKASRGLAKPPWSSLNLELLQEGFTACAPGGIKGVATGVKSDLSFQAY